MKKLGFLLAACCGAVLFLSNSAVAGSAINRFHLRGPDEMIGCGCSDEEEPEI